MNTPELDMDPSRVSAYLGSASKEIAASFQTALIVLGERHRLYQALAGAGPLLPLDLARKTETNERCVREWLCVQAASGYVDYDPASGRFTMPDDQSMLAAESSASNEAGD